MERNHLAEAAARGERAAKCEEFIGPMLTQMRDDYLARMAEIAATELNPKTRTEKITALAVALKIRNNIADGLNAFIEAGKVAQQSLLKAREIERMGTHERRLMDIVPRF